MAFSMFARNIACRSPLFAQPLKGLTTQMVLKDHAVTVSSLPSALFKGVDTTPLLNSVRSFRTTSVRQSEKGHDHAKIWVIERATTAILVPLIPIALLMPNKITDITLAVLICAHSFWGLEAIAVDYVRASMFGPVIPKIAIGLVYLITILTLGGLFYVITHDIGFANTIRQLWAIKSSEQKE